MPGLMGRAVRRLHAREDRGSILLESMIAITVIMIVMGAVGTEFVGGLSATGHQRAQQAASLIADSALDRVRALPADQLVAGRDPGSAQAQFEAAPSAVRPWLTGLTPAYDPASGAGEPTIPTDPSTERPGEISFTVQTYLGRCSLPVSGKAPCGAADQVGGAGQTEKAVAAAFLRAVVAVTWTGQGCRTGSCVLVTSTLVSDQPDRAFPVADVGHVDPSIVTPAERSSVIDDEVDPLQLVVREGTGVPTFTWDVVAGSLPPGLSLSAAGLVTGRAQASGTFTATVRVTDAYAATGRADLTWDVAPALSLTDPGAQATATDTSTELDLAASGGSGAPYTFEVDPGTLPDGLSASADGVISGTATTAGLWTVRVEVADAGDRHHAEGSFTWTVRSPVAPTTPATRTSTVGATAEPLTLSATGGDGTYVWSDPSHTLPSGLSLSADGVVSGTPDTVTDGDGAPVTLTVADPSAGPRFTTQVSFTWRVVAAPTVAIPRWTTDVTLGQSIDVPLTASCPNAPCTYDLLGGPDGLTVTGEGDGLRVSGRVGGDAGLYRAITVRVTDRQGVRSSSDPVTLLVRNQPAFGDVGEQALGEGTTPSVRITYSCPVAPCTITLGGSLSEQAVGVGLNASEVQTTTNATTTLSVDSLRGSVYLNGLVAAGTGSATGTPYDVRLTISDGHGFSPDPTTTRYSVLSSPTVTGPGVVSVARGQTPSVPGSYSCSAATCTIRISGLPDGVTVTSRSAVSRRPGQSLVVNRGEGDLSLTGTISGSAALGDYVGTLSVTADGTTVTSTGLWTVS